MPAERLVLFDFSDRREPSTLRLLDGTGRILLQGYLPGDPAEVREVCLRLAAGLDLTLDCRGPPKQTLAPERPLVPAAAPEDPPLDLVQPQTQAMLF